VDPIDNQNQYEAVLQGVATLCSKRPKESKTDDLEEEPAKGQPQGSRTSQVRYSAAARCRYKKHLQKETGEWAVQASTQQTDAAVNPPGTEEGGPSKAAKHSQSDPSTPSPSGVEQTKKPKVPEQRAYDQAASNMIRVAIVPMAYTDRQFTDKEFVLLKRSVKGRIPDLVMGTNAPNFQGTSDTYGAVIFNCADVETVEWLKSLTTVLTIKEGLQLRALEVDELPYAIELWCTWRTLK
jgi:hypothetical protein